MNKPDSTNAPGLILRQTVTIPGRNPVSKDHDYSNIGLKKLIKNVRDTSVMPGHNFYELKKMMCTEWSDVMGVKFKYEILIRIDSNKSVNAIS